MPIYAYKCSACGHEKDVLQKVSDAPLGDCPACGAAAFAKQITAAGFQLKGSGWYATDFKNGSAKPNAKPADASPDGNGKPAAEPVTAEGAPEVEPAAPTAATDLVHEADPELERLLAEEEEIERRTRQPHETPHFRGDDD